MAKTFGAESTTDEVLEGVNLSGKRILVTGVSAGLGVETTRALVAHGANVVGTARDLAKAKRALEPVIPQAARGASIDLVELDLASLRSVRKAADEIRAQGKRFDVIVANAGVMACPWGKTADGFETQFGTNHLGHFVFVNRLVSLLNSGGRIVSLTSAGHQISDVDLADPNFEHTQYQPFTGYGRSKTANILFAVALDKRLKARGIRATAVHPGGIQTELGRHMTPELIEQLRARWRATTGGQEVRFKSVPQGAATTVWSGCVAAADAIGGRYCEDCHVAEVNDNPATRAGVRSYALDPARAEALWAKSEEMVGERFPLS
jgi:NAD(P)-dependent dehydrogenase (short-subunit alcohol dehydrogenase family)